VSEEFLTQRVEDASQIKDPDRARDKWEFSVVHKALSDGLPVLAICRGHQVLNVALGGTLLLDIPGHDLQEQKYGNLQELAYTSGAKLRFPRVNSSHHQAIDRLGDGLEVEAHHAVDHIIEQVRLRDYPFCVGVQYHPERDPLYRPLFDAFFEKVT
jgi:putative glutamine amidotransferase